MEKLRQHSFVENLEPHLLEMIEGCASERSYEKDESLCQIGKEAKEFYLISKGKVAIELVGAGRGRLVVQTLGPGDVLGWSWLIPPYKWRFNARTVEPTTVVSVSADDLRKKCEENFELGYRLTRRFTYVMTQRLEATRLQLLDLYGTHA